MIDPDHDNANMPAPTSQEHLEVAVFHLTQLYQRLSHDRDHWTRTGEKLAKLIEAFDQHLQRFSTLDQHLKQQLATSLTAEVQQSVQILATMFQQATHAVLTQEIKGASDHLMRLSQETERMLKGYQDHIQSMRNWQMVINLSCALLGGVISAALIVYVLS